MAKAVLVIRPDSIYDDLPEERYHFPHTYLKRAQQAIGDEILYYEPGKPGRKVYFATARLREITPDPAKENHYYAWVDDYIAFTNPVPLRTGASGADAFFEKRLAGADGRANAGVAQHAVRHLTDQEFATIVSLGMAEALRSTEELPDRVEDSEGEFERRIAALEVNRVVRDAAFAHVVRSAYDSTCAMTGLRVVNGGGRCEIEAAHIRSVEHRGPDSPRNGIALSRTFHWMFDRGLLSIEDDFKILVARKLVPTPVQRMINPEGSILKPDDAAAWPHQSFLRYHRENVYVG